MKALLFITFAFLLFTFLSSCSDSSTNPPLPPAPCTKSVTLLTPANDTIYTFKPDTTYFSWSATCTPSKYQIQITPNQSQWESFSWGLTTNNFYQNSSPYPAPNTWVYWRVIAYYGSPVTDSIVSSVFQCKYINP